MKTFQKPLSKEEESLCIQALQAEDAGQETDSGSRKTVSTATEQIPVTWSSAPAYDGGVEGNYVFTADTGRYALSNGVMPTQITVTVSE